MVAQLKSFEIASDPWLLTVDRTTINGDDWLMCGLAGAQPEDNGDPSEMVEYLRETHHIDVGISIDPVDRHPVFMIRLARLEATLGYLVEAFIAVAGASSQPRVSLTLADQGDEFYFEVDPQLSTIRYFGHHGKIARTVQKLLRATGTLQESSVHYDTVNPQVLVISASYQRVNSSQLLAQLQTICAVVKRARP